MADGPSPLGTLPRAPSYYVLQQSRGMSRAIKAAPLAAEAPGGSAIYFWDAANSQFIAPNNLAVDPNIKSGNYVLQAAVFSFHASSADMQNFFDKNASNVQINFQAEAAQDSELVTWIVNAALSTAAQFLGGADNQSVSLGSSPNQLTNIPAPQDQIVVSDGRVSISLGLQAQKKDSW